MRNDGFKIAEESKRNENHNREEKNVEKKDENSVLPTLEWNSMYKKKFLERRLKTFRENFNLV